jgi:hypothetical protein
MRADPGAARPTVDMNRPVSGVSCLMAAAVWLFFAIAPCLAIALAMRGELVWSRGEFVEDRVWVVNEPEAAGLGYSAARLVRSQAAGAPCVRTHVYFLLWKGASETTEYCECYTQAADGSYELTGGCSP